MKKPTKFLVFGLSVIILIVIFIFNQAIAAALDSLWQFLKELNPVYFIILILLPFAGWIARFYFKREKTKVVRKKIESKEINPAQVKYSLELKLKLKQDRCSMKYMVSEAVLKAFQELRRITSPNAIDGSYISFHQITKEKEGYFSVWYKEHREMKDGSAIYDRMALIDGKGKFQLYGPFREKSLDNIYRSHSIKSFHTHLKNNHLEVFFQTEKREDAFRTVPSEISAVRMNLNIRQRPSSLKGDAAVLERIASNMEGSKFKGAKKKTEDSIKYCLDAFYELGSSKFLEIDMAKEEIIYEKTIYEKTILGKFKFRESDGYPILIKIEGGSKFYEAVDNQQIYLKSLTLTEE